jgi:hypothetical protein
MGGHDHWMTARRGGRAHRGEQAKRATTSRCAFLVESLDFSNGKPDKGLGPRKKQETQHCLFLARRDATDFPLNGHPVVMTTLLSPTARRTIA